MEAGPGRCRALARRQRVLSREARPLGRAPCSIRGPWHPDSLLPAHTGAHRVVGLGLRGGERQTSVSLVGGRRAQWSKDSHSLG